MDLFLVKLWCFNHSDIVLSVAMTLTLISVWLGVRVTYLTSKLIELLIKD